MESTESEEQKEKRLKKSEQSIGTCGRASSGPSYVLVIGIPQGGERKRIFEEIMDENFPNLMKHMNTNIQENQQIPSRIKSNRPTLRHIFKLSKERQNSENSQERSNLSHTRAPQQE